MTGRKSFRDIGTAALLGTGALLLPAACVETGPVTTVPDVGSEVSADQMAQQPSSAAEVTAFIEANSSSPASARLLNASSSSVLASVPRGSVLGLSPLVRSQLDQRVRGIFGLNLRVDDDNDNDNNRDTGQTGS